MIFRRDGMKKIAILFSIFFLCLLLSEGVFNQQEHPDNIVATFSIVGFDPDTGDLGVAVQSKFLAVGSVVPWAKAGIGAVATQSLANTSYGPEGLKLLAEGLSAEEALEKLISSDKEKDLRQVGIVDAKGRSAAFTGEKCFDWAGHICGENYSCQGNILVSKETVEAMARTFEQTEGDLAHRLLEALAAGQEAGGDRRGRQSAALLVVREKGGYGGFNDRYIDLRVDDHQTPIKELKRLLELYSVYFFKSKEDELIKIDSALCKELQEVLKRLNYYKGEIDGVFDEETKEALKNFQYWENFDERVRDDDFIDINVLNYIREKYGKPKE
jgi:uncharacterized Ntn-hydrolase superfamily protein